MPLHRRKEYQPPQRSLLAVTPHYESGGGKGRTVHSKQNSFDKAGDKLIKRQQLTLRRLLSLAAIGGIIVAAVSLGGVWLNIGYWAITIGFCILLFLVAIDYGVEMDKVNVQAGTPEPSIEESAKAQPASNSASEPAPAQVITPSRPPQRASRQPKRRR